MRGRARASLYPSGSLGARLPDVRRQGCRCRIGGRQVCVHHICTVGDGIPSESDSRRLTVTRARRVCGLWRQRGVIDYGTGRGLNGVQSLWVTTVVPTS